MRTSLLLLLLLAVPAAAQESSHAGPILICVDDKVGAKDEVALYLRDREGRTRRVFECVPYDVKSLRDGGAIVAERWLGQVTVLDRDMRVTFKKTGLVEPVDVELGQDGTVIVLLRKEGVVVGFDPATGAERWRRTGFTSPFDVEPTPDGGLIVADSEANRLVVLDRDGAIVRTIGGIAFPNCVERLDKGGLLVTNWSGGEVLELDPQGRVLSRWRVGGTIYRAWRRPDGATVVATGDGTLTVYDASGAVVLTERLAHGFVDVEPIEDI